MPDNAHVPLPAVLAGPLLRRLLGNKRGALLMGGGAGVLAYAVTTSLWLAGGAGVLAALVGRRRLPAAALAALFALHAWWLAPSILPGGVGGQWARAADELATLVVAAPSGVEGFVPTDAGTVRRRRSGVGVDEEVTDFSELLRGLTGD